MKRKETAGRRTFFISLGITLFLLITAVGFILVDWQGRRLSFGDPTPPFHLVDRPGEKTELEIRLLGLEKRVDITKLADFFNFLCDFSCIPHK